MPYARLKQLASIMFSRKSDLSTDAERSRDRYRRAAWTSFAAIIQRITNIGVGLVTVPLALNYLGLERFGMWMTLTGFVALLNFADMGIGVGLQNALSACISRDDKVAPRRYITCAFSIVGCIFLAFSVIALVALPLLPLEQAVRLKEEVARAELLPTTQVLMIVFGLNILIGLVQRLFNAMQRGYLAAIQLTLGNLLGLGGIIVTIKFDLGLPVLAASFLGGRITILGLGGLILMAKIPWLRPIIGGLSKQTARELVSTGVFAVGSQVSALLILWFPAIIISSRISAADVAPFSICQRLLGVMCGFYLAGVLSLWPAYSDAGARGEWPWVRRTYKRTLRLWAIGTLPMLLVYVLLGRWVIYIWTQDAEAVPNWHVLIAAGVWFVVHLWGIAPSTALGGLGMLKGQTVYGNLISLTAAAIAWLIAPIYSVEGVLWSMALLGALPRGIAMTLEFRKTMSCKLRNTKAITTPL